MILKILPQILKLSCVNKRKSFSGVSLIIFIAVLSCSGPQQRKLEVEADIENSMTTISENPVYGKVGLLKLSEYGLFQQPLKDLKPTGNLMPYDLNTPLFTDYANKLRFIYIPEDDKIRYRTKEALAFPAQP